MSHKDTVHIDLSPRKLFTDLLAEVSGSLSFSIDGLSHAYILSVLEKHVFNESPFQMQNGEKMLIEAYLEALDEENPLKRQKDLLFLGESILFRSGFFAESFKRKVIGLGYYIDMGKRAYHVASVSSHNKAHEDVALRFDSYVDLFSGLGSKLNLSSGSDDLLVLFDRLLEGGSSSAESQLINLGVVPAQNKKASNQ